MEGFKGLNRYIGIIDGPSPNTFGRLERCNEFKGEVLGKAAYCNLSDDIMTGTVIAA